MKKAISKPVLAMVIAGIALTAFVIWRGPGRHEHTSLTEASTPAISTENATLKVSPDPGPTPGAPLETGLSDLIPLPLGSILVEAENGMWMTNNDYISLPRGIHSYGGIEFQLDGMLQMQGSGSEAAGRQYRNRILLPLAQAGVTNARIGSLHLLGGTRFRSDAGVEVAEIVWRYTNGQSQRSRLVYEEHIREWNRVPYDQPEHLPYAYTKVVWRADSPTPAGRQLRLYRVTMANPEPEKAIRQVELSSGRGAASLFVVAATLDPLAPGARPDDSPDLEPTDPIPPQYLDVWVQTPEGQPLPKAKVRVQPRLKSDNGAPAGKQIAADASGMARVGFPPKNLSRLEITASDDEFASRKMVWDLIAGDVIPSSYQIKLGAGVRIGGSVVDASDLPVAGAKLSFHRFWSGNDEMNRRGDQPEFSSRTTTSDAQGAWQMKGLPPDMLANIMVVVEHPDYLSTNLTVGSGGAVEKQLRAGTHKMVLRRGLEVRGLVTDENGSPLSGATVWAGRQFFRDRQRTNTDDAGRFVFPNVAEGDVSFSAMATGRKPESKTFNVSAAMNEIVFKLGPGSVIKGLVQNQSGEPISGVQVSLEANGPVDLGYEFSATTGADGRFTWDSAPDESLHFYFGKMGYAQLRGQTLKPNFENIVTLRNPGQVQGQVLDADSGQAITKFRVAAGLSLGLDQFYPNYPGTKEFADANGQFTLSIDDAGQNSIRVGADDYADHIQSLPSAQDGVIKMEFRLKPSAALRGIVLGPDGSPMPDVQVAIVKAGFGGQSSLSIRHGKLQNMGRDGPLATTDSSGRFTLGSPPESGGEVVALGASGFGSATVEQVRASGIVMLQAFGQVEGVLKIGGQPASGRELLFTLQNIGVMTDFDNFKVETDDQGKFKFDRLPAGEGQIVRLIKTSPGSWMHSHNTSVLVAPGQTTVVNLGDSGALIKGRARLEALPAEGEPLSISGNLHTTIVPPSFNSPDEARGFYQSPEGQARMKAQQHFGVSVNADGSFLIDSVPPGSYSLMLNASPPGSGPFGLRPGMATITRTVNVTVPDEPNPLVPIELGEIILSAPHKPAP